MAHSLQGAAPPHGKARLRELAVFPTFKLTLGYNFDFAGREWRISDGRSLADEISGLREALQQSPDDLDRILRLAYLLERNEQTNESRLCDQKAEQLCRKRIAVRPQDGLLLVELGEALNRLDKTAEAESVLRKSTLISSNDWRSWASLGFFLESQSYQMLVPQDSHSHAGPSPDLLEAVRDYRPSLDALKTSEEHSHEAARCFGRAVALGNQQPEFWLEHAGYAFTAGWRPRRSRSQPCSKQPFPT
jgi:tetratricopeptide (TPR) repeat protein